MSEPFAINEPDDPRLAGYRALRDPALARTGGVFVAEGRMVVRRIIESRRYRVRSVLVNDAALDALRDVLEAVDAPVYVSGADTVAAISGFNIHRGCVALVDRPAPAAVNDVAAGARTIVALEDVGNADNVGGVFRNAAAFGARVLLSPRCCDPLYRKAIRTSMAAVLSVPWAWVEDWPAELFALRSEGFSIAALTPRAGAEALDAFAARTPRSRIVLVAGTEGAGLTDAVARGADYHVRIPISSEVDSLNVAVAVGIALSRVGGWQAR